MANPGLTPTTFRLHRPCENVGKFISSEWLPDDMLGTREIFELLVRHLDRRVAHGSTP